MDIITFSQAKQEGYTHYVYGPDEHCLSTSMQNIDSFPESYDKEYLYVLVNPEKLFHQVDTLDMDNVIELVAEGYRDESGLEESDALEADLKNVFEELKIHEVINHVLNRHPYYHLAPFQLVPDA